MARISAFISYGLQRGRYANNKQANLFDGGFFGGACCHRDDRPICNEGAWAVPIMRASASHFLNTKIGGVMDTAKFYTSIAFGIIAIYCVALFFLGVLPCILT